MEYETLNDAAKNGDIESVNRLLSQGKDINKGDSIVSDFILVYLLTTTHSVSLLFYYRMIGLH